LISHILCLQQRVEQTDQELALPPGNASCQTTPLAYFRPSVRPVGRA
jgi:hypothetical protein